MFSKSQAINKVLWYWKGLLLSLRFTRSLPIWFAFLLGPQAHIQAVWCPIILVLSYTRYCSDFMQFVWLPSSGSQVLQNRFKDHKAALFTPCHQGDDAAASAAQWRVHLERWNKAFLTLPGQHLIFASLIFPLLLIIWSKENKERWGHDEVMTAICGLQVWWLCD